MAGRAVRAVKVAAVHPPTVTGDEVGRRCPRCETPLYRRHCKYVCPQHGVLVDCSDPFLL
jgi:uncharacterized paraquat-inducible protein A